MIRKIFSTLIVLKYRISHTLEHFYLINNFSSRYLKKMCMQKGVRPLVFYSPFVHNEMVKEILLSSSVFLVSINGIAFLIDRVARNPYCLLYWSTLLLIHYARSKSIHHVMSMIKLVLFLVMFLVPRFKKNNQIM